MRDVCQGHPMNDGSGHVHEKPPGEIEDAESRQGVTTSGVQKMREEAGRGAA